MIVMKGLAGTMVEATNKGIKEFEEYIEPIITERRRKDPDLKDECETSYKLGAGLTATNIMLLAKYSLHSKDAGKKEYIENWGDNWGMKDKDENWKREGGENNYKAIIEKYPDLLELAISVYKLLLSGQSLADVRTYYKGVKL